jgi:ribose transport system substrate-binding protein
MGNNEDSLGAKYTITLIPKTETGIFWSNVYSGASAASTEYNINLVFKGPDNEEDYQTQNEMIRQAVSDGTDAIVFSAIDFLANADAIDEAAAAGVKIVVIDSDVNSDMVSSRIGTDNYGAGRVAGQAVTASDEAQLSIGIVNFNVITENGQSRERGFRSIIAEDPRARIIDTINVVSTVESAKEGTIEMLERNPEINVIATFNEWTSLGVGFAMRELGDEVDIKVVAFDSNVHSVDMLEIGEMDALVIQAPYAMGYLGIETAYRLIQGHEVESVIYTPVLLATRENMYDEEYKRMIFVFDK